MKGFFVTGTDTDVGKTVIASGIASLLWKQTSDVGVFKPFLSGAPRHHSNSDTSWLQRLSRTHMTAADISPFAFQEPLSPFMAAQIENKAVTLADVREHWTRIQHQHRFFIAEGAGGLSVPLGADFLVSDVARLIGLPLLIVARPNLGTLNHTYLTVHYARHIGLHVAGIIINGMPENPGLAEQTAPAEMERLCRVPVLAVVPKLAHVTDEAVEQMAVQHLQSVMTAAGVTQ